MFKTRNIYIAAFLVIHNYGQPRIEPSKDRSDYYDFYFSGDMEEISKAVRTYNTGGLVPAHSYNCVIRELKNLVLEKQSMNKKQHDFNY